MKMRISILQVVAALGLIAICAGNTHAAQANMEHDHVSPANPDAATGHVNSDEDYARGHDALAASRQDLALESFAFACEKGDARGCFNFALISEEVQRGRKASTAPGAQTLLSVPEGYSAACDLGFQRGCAMMIQYLRNSSYGMQDLPRAAALARAGCDAGEALACGELAEMLYAGEGMKADPERAGELFKQACETSGPAINCFNLGLLIEKGMIRGALFDDAKQYYRLGCRRSSNEACINLAVIYARTSDVPDNLAIAAGLLEQACNRGAAVACTNLAVFTLDHALGAKPKVSAATLYRKACDLGDGAACRGLGNLAQEGVREAGSPREGNRLFEKGCELGSGPSCYNAGLMHMIGYKTARRPAIGLRWFARGCDMGSASSCAGAGMASFGTKRRSSGQGPDAARQWLEKARAINPDDPLVLSLSEWLENTPLAVDVPPPVPTLPGVPVPQP